MSEKWTLMWSESAKKELKKLDKHIAKLIILSVSTKFANVGDPLSILKPLKFVVRGQNRYRIGNY